MYAAVCNTYYVYSCKPCASLKYVHDSFPFTFCNERTRYCTAKPYISAWLLGLRTADHTFISRNNTYDMSK